MIPACCDLAGRPQGGPTPLLLTVIVGALSTVLPAQEIPEVSPTEEVGSAEARPTWWEGPGLTGQWGGVRPLLTDHGIQLGGYYLLDVVHNAHGGIERGTVGLGLLELGAVVDLDRLVGWGGAELVGYYQTLNGNSPRDLVGDIQATSNLDVGDIAQLSGLWFRQRLLDEALWVKVGKSDANNDFASPSTGASLFMNAALGVDPTILGFPTYPATAFGASLGYRLAPTVELRAAVFDGAAQAGFDTGAGGPGSAFDSDLDYLYIGEVDVFWSAGDDALPGRAGLGAWRHTGEFARFDGTSASVAAGAYLVADQVLWREEAFDSTPRGDLAAFLQLGIADEDVAPLPLHVGGGLVRQGLFEGRDRDALGLASTWVELNHRAGFDESHEWTTELFYRVQINGWLAVQPDFQYVVNPGGDAALDDAFVVSLRIESVF